MLHKCSKTLTKDEQYMTRATDLAHSGLGMVSPNPQVGCVIVNNDRIIGEGWHEKFGGPHAEVNAIANVKDKKLLNNATVYVNIEPCSHHGKTPPCCDLLIQSKIKRVVISNIDPNPLVSGKGVERLRRNKILVDENVLFEKGRDLNKRFFTFYEKKRPYIILKWAQTSDGFVARENYDSKWISSESSRKIVHKWRAEEDAILVGRGTIEHDNPQLNVRDWSGSDPTRVVIDPQLKLAGDYHIFDQKAKTIVYNLMSERSQGLLQLIRLPSSNFLSNLLSNLVEQGIASIFVEGGATTLKSFIDSGLWDEARVFEAPQTFGKGIEAPQLDGNPYEVEMIGVDKLLYFKNRINE